MHRLMVRNVPWDRSRKGAIHLDGNMAGGVVAAFAAGTAFGAACMYLADPDRGRRRRALIRDQVVHAGHEMGDLGEDARGRAQDLRNRSHGAAHESRDAMSDMAQTSAVGR